MLGGKLRDELLDGELLYTLKEAQILVAGWRRLHDGLRPHSSLGQQTAGAGDDRHPGLLAGRLRAALSYT